MSGFALFGIKAIPRNWNTFTAVSQQNSHVVIILKLPPAEKPKQIHLPKHFFPHYKLFMHLNKSRLKTNFKPNWITKGFSTGKSGCLSRDPRQTHFNAQNCFKQLRYGVYAVVLIFVNNRSVFTSIGMYHAKHLYVCSKNCTICIWLLLHTYICY
jgi:hypothetical protein